MKKSYIFGAMATVLFASCGDDIDPRVPVATPGADIEFQATFDPQSRTAYGDLGSTSRPIYWVNGDLIRVASPQCDPNFDSAIYRVEVKKEGQNYADRLVHNEAAGVRWADSDTPATDYKFFAFYPETSVYFNDNDAEFAAHISEHQNSVMTNNNGKWSATTYDMENNIMYAQPIAGQNQVTTVGDKTVANLKFKPLSTVIHFNFAGWTTTNQDLVNEGDLTIFSVSLKCAGTRVIAGNFPVMLHADGSTPSVMAAREDAAASHTITLTLQESAQLNGFTPKNGEPFECDMFLIPNGQTINNQWTLSVETSSGTFERTLTPATGANTTLKPGEIHIMDIPAISINNGWDYKPASWLEDINDNVYFTEVSLPGSWYSASNGSDKYQDGTIAQQFAAGVRAFHMETKCGTTKTSATRNVVISGSGKNASGGTYYSATAIAPTVDEIASQLKANTKEFAVLVLSYADGGKGGVSDKDFADWLQLVNNTFDSSKSTTTGILGVKQFEAISADTEAKLFTGELTPNTPVSALRGKLLVVLNVAKKNTAPTGYAAGNFLYAYTHADWTSKASQVSQAYWKNWSNSYLTGVTGNVWESNPNTLYFNYTFANRTSTSGGADIPSYADRETAIQSIIANSKAMRGKGRHNMFFFVGAGGTQAANSTASADNDGPTSVAKKMNPYLLQQINEKIKAGEASPLGLVYTNFTTGTTGKQVVDAIIRMNRRFKLLEIGGTNSGGGSQTVENTPANYSSSHKVGGDAWSRVK